jgi:hypothetical protein
MVNCGRLSTEPRSPASFCVDLTLISDGKLNLTLGFLSQETAHAPTAWTLPFVIISQNTPLLVP